MLLHHPPHSQQTPWLLYRNFYQQFWITWPWFGCKPNPKPLADTGTFKGPAPGKQLRIIIKSGHNPTGCWVGWNQTVIPFYDFYNFGWTVSAIKFLGSDCIMTWSICRLYRVSHYFTSRLKIGDPTSIYCVAGQWGYIFFAIFGCFQ